MKEVIDFDQIIKACREFPVVATESATRSIVSELAKENGKIRSYSRKNPLSEREGQNFSDLISFYRVFILFDKIGFPFELWAEVVQQGVPILREYAENPHLGPLKDRRGFAEWMALREEVIGKLARDPKYSEMFFILMDLW